MESVTLVKEAMKNKLKEIYTERELLINDYCSKAKHDFAEQLAYKETIGTINGNIQALKYTISLFD